MMYTISTPGQQVVLTLSPDASINTPNLSRNDMLLDRVVSPSLSSIIFDLGSVVYLNSIGSWTIFQIAFKAREDGKNVYFYNVEPSIKRLLVEVGILSVASLIHTKEELDTALRGNKPSPISRGLFADPGNENNAFAEGL